MVTYGSIIVFKERAYKTLLFGLVKVMFDVSILLFVCIAFYLKHVGRAGTKYYETWLGL
jgi:hypothetical protein